LSLLALLAALLAQHARPVSGRQPLLAFYGRMCLSAAKRLNAGDRNSGILAWLALMGAVLVRSRWSLARRLAARGLPLGARGRVPLRDAALLRHHAPASPRSSGRCARANTVAAASLLGTWRGEPIESEDPAAIAQLAAEHGLREAHQGTFAPLLWYLVLPGPLGLVLYPLALRAARSWEHVVEPEERDFGWFAAQAFRVIDWVPQRVSAFVFAIAGNFEDALYCWRSQAAQWMRPEEGIVLASGAGRAGREAGGARDGEAAREDALASLEGLLWRVLVVWLDRPICCGGDPRGVAGARFRCDS
jgi:cobalamin biosynthesis protein CobD/CbiB